MTARTFSRKRDLLDTVYAADVNDLQSALETLYAAPFAGSAYIVASADAPTKVMAIADYLCDGVADDVQINAAIAAANAANVNRVVLVGAAFYTAAPIVSYDHIIVEGLARHARTAIYCRHSGVMFTSGNSATGPSRFFTLRNLYFYGGTDVAGCTTSTPLAGAATFTGTATDVSAATHVRVQVTASHASAANGCKVDFGPSNTGPWTTALQFTVAANVVTRQIVAVADDWMRVTYTNGATLQTSFALYTYLPLATQGVSIPNAIDLTADGVRVENIIGNAWHLDADVSYSGYNRIQDCHGRNADRGLFMGGPSSLEITTVCQVFGGAFNFNDVGIESERGISNTLNTVDVSANSIAGMKVGGTNTVIINPYAEQNAIDYWFTSTSQNCELIGHPLFSGAEPAMIRNDGNNPRLYGSDTPNLLPNGNFAWWPGSGTVPPGLTFVAYSDWTVNTTKVKTATNTLELTSGANSSFFVLDLTSLLDQTRYRQISVGVHWRGDASNSSGSVKRIDAYTTASGGAGGTKVDTDIKSYAFFDTAQSEGVNTAWCTITPSASATGMYLYFEVSSDATGNGDIITIDDIFVVHGDRPPFIGSVTEGNYAAKLALVGTSALTIARGDATSHAAAIQPARDLKAGRYYGHQATYGGTGTTLALAASTLYGIPFVLDEATTADRITLGITGAAAAGKLIRLGLYTSFASTSYPDALLVDSGALAADAIANVIATISTALDANTLYFLACITDGTPTVRAITGGRAVFGNTDASDTTSRSMPTRALTYGALPASWGTPSGLDTVMPHILIRAS